MNPNTNEAINKDAVVKDNESEADKSVPTQPASVPPTSSVDDSSRAAIHTGTTNTQPNANAAAQAANERKSLVGKEFTRAVAEKIGVQAPVNGGSEERHTAGFGRGSCYESFSQPCLGKSLAQSVVEPEPVQTVTVPPAVESALLQQVSER